MPLRSALVLSLLAVLLSSGCSRLSFVKPSAQRGDSEQVAPRYDVSGTAESRRRSENRLRLARAGQALANGESDAAEKLLREALKADPGDPDGLTLMAVLESRRGRSREAGGYYAKAAELAPASGRAQSNYGAWLCDNGRAAEAMPYFDRALATPGYPEPAFALANAGACAEAAGQPGRVERDLRAALSLQPTNAVALSAMAEYQYRKGSYLEARAFSQRRLAAAPASADVLLLASQIEERLGDKAAADRYRQRLGKEFPQALSAQPGESSQP